MAKGNSDECYRYNQPQRFRALSGDIIYILFEQTFEKNVHPHTPDRSCVGIGRISEVMRRIVSLASSCEGGMLQNRGGWIVPENYLRSWMRELSVPFQMSNEDYTLQVRKGFCDSVPESKLPEVGAALSEIGHGEIAGRLRDGKSVSAILACAPAGSMLRSKHF